MPRDDHPQKSFGNAIDVAEDPNSFQGRMQQAAAGVGQVAGDAVAGLRDRWHNWIEEPGNREFLLQTSLNLMQPISPGQSILGHVGQSIGYGEQARLRGQEGDLSEEDLLYKRSQSELEADRQEAERQARLKLLERQVRVSEQNAKSLEEYRKSGGAAGSTLTGSMATWIGQQAIEASKQSFLNDDNPRTPESFLMDPDWNNMMETWYLQHRLPTKSNVLPGGGAPAATGGTSTLPPPQPQTPATAQPPQTPQPQVPGGPASATPPSQPGTQPQGTLPGGGTAGTTTQQSTAGSSPYPDGYVQTNPDGSAYRKVTVGGKTGWVRVK